MKDLKAIRKNLAAIIEGKKLLRAMKSEFKELREPLQSVANIKAIDVRNTDFNRTIKGFRAGIEAMIKDINTTIRNTAKAEGIATASNAKTAPAHVHSVKSPTERFTTEQIAYLADKMTSLVIKYIEFDIREGKKPGLIEFCPEYTTAQFPFFMAHFVPENFQPGDNDFFLPLVLARLADLKSKTAPVPKRGDLSKMENKTIREFYQLVTLCNGAQDIRNRIDLNQQLRAFKQAHELETVTDTADGYYITLKGFRVAHVQQQYAARKVNLCYKKLGRKLVFCQPYHATMKGGK